MPDPKPTAPSAKPISPTPIEWHAAVDQVRPLLLRIATPDSYGTGFVLAHFPATGSFAVATAAHVVAHAHDWKEPIRLEHQASGNSLLLQPDKRIISVNTQLDTAIIAFAPGTLSLPTVPFRLIEQGQVIKVGVEIGWLGFPALSPDNLCFFTGRISAIIDEDSAYLVDGVAINGVSGGPALWIGYDRIYYMGVVSQYIPNRASGEPLPGLAVIRTVEPFHIILKMLQALPEQASNPQPPLPPLPQLPPLPRYQANTTPPAGPAQPAES